jgi:hypothetical protein
MMRSGSLHLDAAPMRAAPAEPGRRRAQAGGRGALPAHLKASRTGAKRGRSACMRIAVSLRVDWAAGGPPCDVAGPQRPAVPAHSWPLPQPTCGGLHAQVRRASTRSTGAGVGHAWPRVTAINLRAAGPAAEGGRVACVPPFPRWPNPACLPLRMDIARASTMGCPLASRSRGDYCEEIFARGNSAEE